MKLSDAIMWMLDAQREYDRWSAHMEKSSRFPERPIDIDGQPWTRDAIIQRYKDAAANLQARQDAVDAFGCK